MKTKLSIYIEPELAERLRVEAERTGLPYGELVELALKALLDEDGGPRGSRKAMRSGPGAAHEVARELRAGGLALLAIADRLNERGFRTSRGRPWSVMAVSRLLRQHVSDTTPHSPKTPGRRSR